MWKWNREHKSSTCINDTHRFVMGDDIVHGIDGDGITYLSKWNRVMKVTKLHLIFVLIGTSKFHN